MGNSDDFLSFILFFYYYLKKSFASEPFAPQPVQLGSHGWSPPHSARTAWNDVARGHCPQLMVGPMLGEIKGIIFTKHVYFAFCAATIQDCLAGSGGFWNNCSRKSMSGKIPLLGSLSHLLPQNSPNPHGSRDIRVWTAVESSFRGQIWGVESFCSFDWLVGFFFVVFFLRKP